MKLLRFAVPGLCVLGVAVCLHGLARLVGWVPPGKLPLYPGWAAVHFVTAAGFAVLAPLQLWTGLRTRRPDLHRAIGRTAVALGGVMAVSGLALAYAAPGRPVSERIFMTAFTLAYTGFLALGVRAALGRDTAAHRAWMIRMVATALTPLTQRLIFPLFAVAVGVDSRDTFWQLFVSAAWLGWAVDMLVAEAWLRGVRPAARPALA
jgi:uncharacterized membrane protein